MDYKRIYDDLMARAKSRKLKGYIEKHHIIPKCMGGSDDRENITGLTPEEHYVAHQLLVKIYPEIKELLWALTFLTVDNYHTQKRSKNKLYGWIKRKQANARSKEMKGKKRGPYDPEKVKKRGEHRRGIKHTKEAREKMSKAKLGKKRGPRKKKTIEKIRRSNIEVAKNRDFSYLQDDDYKKEQSRKMKEIWRLRKEGKLPMPQRKSKE